MMVALTAVFDYSQFWPLVALIRWSLVAALVLGVLGGIIGVIVMQRDLPFAVHGISELSFAGAAAALLLGGSVVGGSLVGSILAAVIIGALGSRARERNSIVGVLMPFGLGLGILFLSLYDGRTANRFGLLTGQIVAVDTPQAGLLIVVAVIALTGVAVLWRPLLFSSVDEEGALARRVPVRLISMAFMVLLGLTTAVAVQIVGALLVLAILVTPAAAAMRLAVRPAAVVGLSVAFATVSLVGGILVALGTTLPISPFVTTLSFAIYLVCRLLGGSRTRAVHSPA